MLQSQGSLALWAGFLGLILLLLAFDLGVLSRQPRGLTAREAIVRFLVWVALAAGFGGFVYWHLGPKPAYEFAAGYLLEESLSVDNIFVIILIFRAFKIPGRYQHRVLYWGILGAVVLRATMIIGGSALVQRFHWVNYLFGAFLLFTGLKLFFTDDDEDDEGSVMDGWVVRQVKRVLPVSDSLDEARFFTRNRGKLIATPLLLVLATVELSDVAFALDSIPAVFGVTTDPFIIFTSNIFAILGLRTLYFLVASMIDAFRFLKVGLAVILTFVGAKMCVAHWYELPISYALVFIASVLLMAVAMSLIVPQSEESAE